MTPRELLADIIARHGGRDRWRQLKFVDVSFDAGGLAFALRGLDPTLLRNVNARFLPHATAAKFADFPRRGSIGICAPDRVRILDEKSTIVLDRSNPRARFSALSRQLRWDEGDLLYFAGYAMWSYVCFPFCLARPGVEACRAAPWGGAGWRLDVRFPANFATHSQLQSFYFDETLRLQLHTYCAEVIGPYARASHQCFDYGTSAGFSLSRRRRVTPRLWGSLFLSAPTLVWIDIASVEYVTGGSEAGFEHVDIGEDLET
jgi:hypothetical protein